MNATSPGRLVIISGPSGAGKSTVLNRLLRDCPLPLVLSVSATTRAPRAGEKDGVHYHFLSREEFHRRREAGEFLECMEVFGRGDWYGTLAREVSTGLAEGKWVILEIDVEGTLRVLQSHPDAITIFLHPGSPEELRRRLVARGTETEEAIRRRLEVAARELTFIDRYRHEVINDEVAAATTRICEILTQAQED
jgi:guanylate kinase